MTKQEFIDAIAKSVKKYAPQYGVKVYSPIIAQACLESAYGTSELARNANNYFGLKFHASVSEKPAYHKVGTEQLSSGGYVASDMAWCSFYSLDSGVKGYFNFLFNRAGITRYNNLKGVTNPQTYLTNIKSDGYASSLNYVQNNMNVINEWNLTKYDVQETPKYYRVQIGAYSVKSNAEALAAKLKVAGFNAIIKQYDNLYKVQCGAFSTKANAETLQKQIKAKGYDTIIVYN